MIIKREGQCAAGLIQGTDNYFRFWYAFVFPNISELETGAGNVVRMYDGK